MLFVLFTVEFPMLDSVPETQLFNTYLLTGCIMNQCTDIWGESFRRRVDMDGQI